MSSPRTHSGWAAVGPMRARAARSRLCASPFPQLVARRLGCNPRGLQEGEGTAVLAGREEVVKSIKEKLCFGRGVVMIVCTSVSSQILLSLLAECVF